jgi:hypothetical protein
LLKYIQDTTVVSQMHGNVLHLAADDIVDQVLANARESLAM